jgi:hypothetical protein
VDRPSDTFSVIGAYQAGRNVGANFATPAPWHKMAENGSVLKIHRAHQDASNSLIKKALATIFKAKSALSSAMKYCAAK